MNLQPSRVWFGASTSWLIAPRKRLRKGTWNGRFGPNWLSSPSVSRVAWSSCMSRWVCKSFDCWSFTFINRCTHRLIDWLIVDWSINRLTVRSIDWLIDWLNDRLSCQHKFYKFFFLWCFLLFSVKCTFSCADVGKRIIGVIFIQTCSPDPPRAPPTPPLTAPLLNNNGHSTLPPDSSSSPSVIVEPGPSDGASASADGQVIITLETVHFLVFRPEAWRRRQRSVICGDWLLDWLLRSRPSTSNHQIASTIFLQSFFLLRFFLFFFHEFSKRESPLLLMLDYLQYGCAFPCSVGLRFDTCYSIEERLSFPIIDRFNVECSTWFFLSCGFWMDPFRSVHNTLAEVFVQYVDCGFGWIRSVLSTIRWLLLARFSTVRGSVRFKHRKPSLSGFW